VLLLYQRLAFLLPLPPLLHLDKALHAQAYTH
jgi:hypothetical protein